MIDILIVALYLIIVLVVGIAHGFRIKNLEQYSIAKNSYSTFVLIAAIFATLVGGGATMGVAEKVYSTGVIFLFAAFGFVIRDIITAILIANKIKNFEGCYTAGDIIGKYYGKKGKILVGIAGTLQCNAILGMQVSALGHLLYYFFNMPYSVGVGVSMGVVVLYSSFGGIKAVTITDVIQFGVIVVAIPLTFVMGISMVGGYYGIINSVPVEKLSIIPSSADSIRYFSLFFVFSLPYLCPAVLQRMLMAKDSTQIRKSLIFSALGRLPYMLMVGALGLVSYILEPTLKPDLALPFLVNEILPIGIKGFVVAGILAVIMSTADSYLHLVGLMFSHDVIKPILGNKINEKNELTLVRIATLVIGSLSILAAIYNENIIELNILAYAFWLPAIFVPLFSAIYGVYASFNGFLISAVLAVLTQLMWKQYFYVHTSIDSLLPAVLVNAVVFFSIYFFEKKKYLPKSITVLENPV